MAKKQQVLINAISPENLGLTGALVIFSVKTPASLATINKALPYLTVDRTIGNGLLQYIGKSDVEQTVFLGSNKKLGTSILTFSGNKGLEKLDKFRTEFLDTNKGDAVLAEMTVSSLEATFVCPSPETFKSISDLDNSFGTIVKVQQKSLPKVSIENRTLFIGGRSSSASLSIKGYMDNDLTVKYLVSSLKLKDKACANFYSSVQSSMSVSTETLLANAILTQISRITTIGVLETIRIDLIKNYDVNKVITINIVETKAVTASGKYVTRALSGVRNKMSDKKSYEEAQTIFINWWAELKAPTGKHSKPVLMSYDFNAFYSCSLACLEGPNALNESTNPTVDPSLNTGKPEKANK